MIVLQESIDTNRPVSEVFNYIADFTTTVEWDSTVKSASKVSAGPVAEGTHFSVTCATPLGPLEFDYCVTRFDPEAELKLLGTCRFFKVEDHIRFTPIDKGTRIDYRAAFRFPESASRIEKFLEPGLQRMGRRSMEGMRLALEDNFPTPSATESHSLGDRLVLPGLVKFTRRGYRRSSRNWHPQSAYLKGKHIVITGASSGLGRSAALELARRGAELTLVMRDRKKADIVTGEIKRETGNKQLHREIADLSLLGEVDRLAHRLLKKGQPIDALINNAGALFNHHAVTAEGIERSLALLLLSPVRLTEGVKPLLRATPSSRVINVLSGGMFTQKLELDKLIHSSPDHYSGATAYALAKRALMVVTEQWARDWESEGIVVNAMHPGWADTPGVAHSLPGFYRLTKRWLRTPEEGADTMVWLASATEAGRVSGLLFLDREPQSTHPLPWTRESEQTRDALLDYLNDVHCTRGAENLRRKAVGAA